MPEAHSFLTFWAYPAHSCVSSFCLRERLEKGSQRDKEGTWGGNVHYSCCENQWWAEWRGRRLLRASASAPKPVPNTNKWSPWINISILWALFILTRVTLASSRALRGRRNNPCTFYKVSAEVRTGPCSQGLSDCVTSSQVCVCVCVCVWTCVQLLGELRVKVTQLCPTLCDPMDYTVHGLLQARMLEWVAFPFSRGLSQPSDQTFTRSPW